MNSPVILKCFTQNRHINSSTWLLTQSYKKVPRSCRLQATCNIFFPASMNEVVAFAEENCPPNMSHKEFIKVIQEATTEKYNFLFINHLAGHDKKYRKNLDEIIEFNN